MGQTRFLVNVSEKNWPAVCAAAYESLFSQLRKSSTSRARLWLTSMAASFFEKQYDNMLLAACQPDSTDARTVFATLIAERDKRTGRAPFNYFFHNGALLRRASIVGAPKVAEYALAQRPLLCTDSELAQILLDCTENAIRFAKWRTLQCFLRFTRTCGRNFGEEFRSKVRSLLQPLMETRGDSFEAVNAAFA
jgi:hypothetical protein